MNTKIYAGWLKNRNELLKSSSGGAFTALSNVFLKKGDAILCSAYNYKAGENNFSLIYNREKRDAARGSKYFQSIPGNAFRDALLWLKENPCKKLLFVGMGCQAEGFRKLVEIVGVRERVYLIDIICTGVASPLLWKEYLKSIGDITYLTFKDKRNGWYKPTAYVKIDNKEKLIDDFVKVFYSHNSLRPSCYECIFAKVERNTDITIGDFWHIEKSMPEFYNVEGNSLFLVHTEKGMELFEEAKDDIVWCESNIEACWQNMLERPTPRPVDRSLFWENYRKLGVEFIMKKYGTISIKKKIIKRLRKVIGKYINL